MSVNVFADAALPEPPVIVKILPGDQVGEPASWMEARVTRVARVSARFSKSLARRAAPGVAATMRPNGGAPLISQRPQDAEPFRDHR